MDPFDSSSRPLPRMDDPFAPLPSDSSFSSFLTPEESSLFNIIFRSLDVDKSGTIPISPAAAFLARSRLPQHILREIWDLSDLERKGALDKKSLFRALKYVAVAQTGKPLTANSLNLNTPLPTFDGIPSDPQPTQPPKPLLPQVTGASSYSLPRPATITRNPSLSSSNPTSITNDVTTEEKERFRIAFNQCTPTNGFADATKSRATFLKSSLSPEILAQVWTSVDSQATGKLNLQQFSVAMFLISRIKSGQISGPLTSIPESIWNAFKETTEAPLLLDFSNASGHLETLTQNVPPNEKAQADHYFDTLDVDKKGYLTGQQSYAFFLKSSLPQSVLAEIWNQADSKKTGKLDREQFAYAMHLVRLKKNSASSYSSILSAPNETRVIPPLVPQPTGRPITESLDLLSLDAPPPPSTMTFSGTTTLPSISSIPGRSSIASISINPIQSFEQSDLLEKECELNKKKQEYSDLTTQLKTLQPASDELKKKREQVESELRQISEQKNAATMKVSQLRATFEAELQIIQDLEQSLNRERQFSEVLKTEQTQLEKTVHQMMLEKKKLSEQIEKYKNDIADMQAQMTGYKESSNQLQKHLERLRNEIKEQETAYIKLQQAYQIAQSEYQLLRKESQSLEKTLEQEKAKTEDLAEQIAIQTAINISEGGEFRANN